MGTKANLTGARFGRLTAIADTGRRNSSGAIYWHCQCDCGTRTETTSRCLASGQTRSCGCLFLETAAAKGRARRTHGKSHGGDRTYTSWTGMRDRCLNPNNERFARYGGRGISICARWDDFATFLQDMGECPKGMTLDRVKVNGNYEPGNCRWATQLTQQNNRTNNVRLDIAGVSMTMSQAARAHGLTPDMLQQRLKRGDTVARALRPPEWL